VAPDAIRQHLRLPEQANCLVDPRALGYLAGLYGDPVSDLGPGSASWHFFGAQHSNRNGEHGVSTDWAAWIGREITADDVPSCVMDDENDLGRPTLYRGTLTEVEQAPQLRLGILLSRNRQLRWVYPAQGWVIRAWDTREVLHPGHEQAAAGSDHTA
jgi:hypothetical protein